MQKGIGLESTIKLSIQVAEDLGLGPLVLKERGREGASGTWSLER